MARKTTKVEISEEKVRHVIWMLKRKKTKKECCEYLGISYSPKRLDTIIIEFRDKQERTKQLKANRAKTPFTDAEKRQIVKDYNEGESQSSIAKRLYSSPQKIKSILIEMNVPIRARSKHGEAKVEHITQDLDVQFNKKDKVFIPKQNSFGEIIQIYDEDWLEYYSQPERRRYVELHPMKDARKRFGEDFEGKEDVHWNIYWCYSNGEEWKEHAIKAKIKSVETTLETQGREDYLVWTTSDESHYMYSNREDLIPIKV
jgi:hypothetical protein